MKGLHMVAWILVIIGALNWGLAAFGWGIGSWGFIPSIVLTIVYVLIGLSAVYEILVHKSMCKMCCGGTCGTKGEGMKCEGMKCNGMKKDGMKM